MNRRLLEELREEAGQPRQQTGEHQAMSEAEARALLAVHKAAIKSIPREDDDEPDTDPETMAAKERQKHKR